MSIGRLHILTDFHFQQRLSHAELAERAIRGGADVIQFRQKQGTIRSKLYELMRTAGACRAGGALLIVDDHLDLALIAGAGGVHLGQDDLPVAVARTILGNDMVIGATASAADEARRAEDTGADYIGFGPVFPTASKANPAPVRGLRGLEAACRAVEIPVIGIAGITPERVHSVIDAGAHGIAVMTAVTTASDVEAATAEFRRAVDNATGG
jgi:thiamine-phosphate pyrophosphorylase